MWVNERSGGSRRSLGRGVLVAVTFWESAGWRFSLYVANGVIRSSIHFKEEAEAREAADKAMKKMLEKALEEMG